MRNSAGGLVLLGAGVMILLMFFTGRLEWLFQLGRDVNAARTPAPAATGTGAGGSGGAGGVQYASARPAQPSLRGVGA